MIGRFGVLRFRAVPERAATGGLPLRQASKNVEFFEEIATMGSL